MNRIASLIVFALASVPAVALGCINTLYYQTAFATRPADYLIVGLLFAAGIIAGLRAKRASSATRELSITFSGVIGGVGLGLLLATHEGVEINRWVYAAIGVFVLLLAATYNRAPTQHTETEFESLASFRVARVGGIVATALIIAALGAAMLLNLRRQAHVTAEPESFRTYHEPVEVVF